MVKNLNLDLGEVLGLYASVLRKCPDCGKPMIPLGDPPDEPQHYCPDCKTSYSMDNKELEPLTLGTKLSTCSKGERTP